MASQGAGGTRLNREVGDAEWSRYHASSPRQCGREGADGVGKGVGTKQRVRVGWVPV